METVTIDGIKYIIHSTREFVFAGSVRHELFMRRPKGKRFYAVVRYENGTYGSVL